jgi:uncharacterized membrane protein
LPAGSRYLSRAYQQGVELVIYLVLGLVIFLGLHSISIVAPMWRDRTAARFGNAWRGLYSLVAIAGFALIILGYGRARLNPLVWYAPPDWARYVTAILMLPVFPLLLAAYFPGRIRHAIQHPMLTGTILWALAHLIATGTLASVVLFGGFLAWAIADRVSYGSRTQRAISTAPPGKLNDLIAVVGGLLIYVVFEHWLHVRWIGVQPLPM